MSREAREALDEGAIFAWAERYKATPWTMLALSTSADKQPGPMHVFQSALLALSARINDLAAARTREKELREALGRAAVELAYAHASGIKPGDLGSIDLALAYVREGLES